MSKRARDEDASLPQQPRRKRLGASDIEVCEVCLGTMTFGSMTADEATCHQILDRYVALGGNFIDTARVAPLITERTKAVIVNSPGNPTGVVLSAALSLSATTAARPEAAVWRSCDSRRAARTACTDERARK